MSAYTLEIIKPTVFKRSTAQSETLPQDQRFVPTIGTTYHVKALLEDVDTNHVKVTFDHSIKGFNTWYAYKDHIVLDESKAEPNRQPENIRIVVPQRAGAVIRLPGGSQVSLSASVNEGSSFYWYEATHNSSRIPTTIKQVQNIKAIARLADQAKGVITAEAIKRQKIPMGKNVPIIVTSWFRPPTINKAIGGSKKSQHLEANAIDFVTPHFSNWEVWEILDSWFPGGLGIYGGGNPCCHIDARGYRARWKPNRRQ
ncbi:MAG: DUF882 domain-containing protein [Leptolyngbyaceae cyanobacterium SL_5_14]|nr:DUF882 domain-containing protein [Leptolyngbyaceae cyanobacterium SL_5_14]